MIEIQPILSVLTAGGAVALFTWFGFQLFGRGWQSYEEKYVRGAERTLDAMYLNSSLMGTHLAILTVKETSLPLATWRSNGVGETRSDTLLLSVLRWTAARPKCHRSATTLRSPAGRSRSLREPLDNMLATRIMFSMPVTATFLDSA